MEELEVIMKLEDFFDLHKEYLIKAKRRVVSIDFWELSKFDTEITDYFLEEPEEVYALFQQAIRNIKGDNKNYEIVINNCDINKLKISNIRKDHIDKFHVFEGVVSRVTDVILNITSIKFECTSCGATQTMIQDGNEIRAPKVCKGCKYRNPMKVLKKNHENIQKIMIEDFILEKDGTQKPVMKMVLLKEHLTTPRLTQLLQPGSSVKIAGTVKTREVCKKSLEEDFFIEANSVEVVQNNLYSLPLTKKDKEECVALSKDPEILDKLSESISPGTEGMEIIKKALTVQQFRADNVADENGKLDDRGTINIALIGNPGSSKTYLAKKAVSLNPISLFTSGKGLSGVGLVAAVTQDPTLKAWVLDAGAVPLCNKGIICIDEMDKISPEDLGFLNNAMNDLNVPVNKANVRAVLETDVCFLCTANPRHRVFDTYSPKFQQFGLAPDFLDRFDLIFALEAPDDEAKRRSVIKKIIRRHKKATKAVVSKEMYTKYVAYAWQNIHPIIPDEIEDYIMEKISAIIDPNNRKQSEVSVRIVGSVLRLAKATARLYYSKKVRKKDVDFAVELMLSAFKSSNMIDETEHLNVDNFQMATPESKVKLEAAIMQYLNTSTPTSYQELKSIFSEADELDFESTLKRLNKCGDIIEVKRNQYVKNSL